MYFLHTFAISIKIFSFCYQKVKGANVRNFLRTNLKYKYRIFVYYFHHHNHHHRHHHQQQQANSNNNIVTT